MLAVLAVYLLLRAPDEPDGRAPDAAAAQANRDAQRPVLQGAPSAKSPSPSGFDEGTDIRGHVLEEGTDAPVGGALIFLVARDEEVLDPHGAVATAADGSFSIPRANDVPVGAGLLVASTTHAGARVPLPTTPGAGTDLVIRLARGEAISGVVVDGLGNPIEGATVVCLPPDGLAGWPARGGLVSTASDATGGAARSGANGTFRVTGLGKGLVYAVHAEMEGYTPERQRLTDELLVLTGAEGVEVVMLACRTFWMRVVDEDTSQPIPTGQVVFSLLGPLSMFGEAPGVQAAWRGADPRPRSDEALARVCLPRGVPAPDVVQFDVHAFAMGYGSVLGVFDADWERPQPLVFRLKRRVTAEPVPVRFRAGYGPGTPFTGALGLVFHRQDDESPARIPAIVELFFEDGRAREALPLVPGRYSVNGYATRGSQAWWYPGLLTELLVPTDAVGGVDATLEVAGGVLRLTVLDRQGRRRRGYSLSVTYADGSAGSEVFTWDYPGFVDPGVAEQTARVCSMPGTVEAWLPGVGRGRASFPKLEGGTLLEVKILLDEACPVIPTGR